MDRSRLLCDGPFLRLWTAIAASGMATWGLPFVFGLAVVDRSLTPGQLGSLLAARTLGYVAAVPLGGVLADRLSSRRVVLVAGSAAAAGIALVTAGLGRWPALMTAGAAVAGAGHGASRPAFQALIPDVVDPADPARLQEANAAVTLAVQGTALVPPAVAALLTTAVGTRALLGGTALMWVAAALLPPRGRPVGAPAGDVPRPAYGAEIVAGAREARRHPWFVAGLAALSTVVATGFSATAVALPLVSRDRYGSEAVLASATTAYTAGALAGALVVARWRPAAPGRVALAGLASYAAAPLGLALPAHPAAVVGAYAVAGAGVQVFNVPWFTATQREVPAHLLARVSALDFLATYGLAPVGLAVVAPAIDRFGTTPVLAACAAACAVAPAAAAAVPSSRAFSRCDAGIGPNAGTIPGSGTTN